MEQASALGTATPDGVLVPVQFEQGMVETDEKIDRNIRACLSKPYRGFNSVAASPWRQSLSIFGSGPSIDWTVKHARGDVMACNAAHDFLLRHKITPRYAMMWDPVEVMNDLITPHPAVTYLLASRCHQNIFKRFEKNKVVVWHAAGDTNIQKLLQEAGKMEPMIMGGSTAVTRAIFLAAAMGYLDQHIFGADSSCDGGSHIRKSVVDEQYMQINCLGRWFTTTPWLAVQAEDFKVIAPILVQAGVKMTFYGDGLIPHIAKGMGFTVIGDPQQSNYLETTRAA